MFNKLRVLLIEDNPGDANLVEKYLNNIVRPDYRISHAKTIERAKELLKSNTYDIILIDLALPDGDGIEEIDNLDKIYGEELPKIILTGMNDEDRAITAVKKGVQDYLIKNDINKELLNKSIKYSIERHSNMVKLKKLSALKDDFLAIISHDLRTPLAGISGFSELMLLDSSYDLPEHIKEYLELIKSTADTQLKYINDILFVLKHEAGQMNINLYKVDTKEFFYKTLEPLIIIAQNKKIKIQANCLVVSQELYFDRPKIAQVINNLVTNAIKFSPHNSELLIECKINHSKELEFHVVDQGPGIRKDKINSLFTKFVRYEDKNNQDNGMGLGLFICKNFIELHGGIIGVESEQGTGSTFYFKIPLKNLKHGKK